MVEERIAANADPTRARWNPDGRRTGDWTVGWETDVDAETTGRPAVAGGSVYVATDDGLFAVDAADGGRRWHDSLADRIAVVPPVVDGGTVYVATYDDLGRADEHVHALDAETGATEWAVEASPGTKSPLTVAGDTVFVAEHGGRVVARDAATGERQWVTSVGTTASACAVTDGTAVVASGDELLALATADGSVRWRSPVDDDVTAGPVFATGSAFVGTADGTVQAFDAGTGDRQWSTTVFDERIHDATRHLSGHPDRFALADVRSLASDGDRLYAGTFNALLALDAETGEPDWTLETDSGYLWSQTVLDHRVYAGSSGGTVYEVGTFSGTVTSRRPHDADAYPTVADGSLYLVTRAGALLRYA